ncbi:lysophospholipid acyltransferase family protein [Haloechinothrix salitolerans]
MKDVRDEALEGQSAQVIPLRSPERGGSQRRRQPADAVERHGDAAVVNLPGSANVASSHAGAAATSEGAAAGQEELVPDVVGKALDFLRGRLTGEYDVDEFGFDPELTETVLLPALRVLYDKWFRVEVHGAENLPLGGGGLVVCNHSGTIPLDALMTMVAVHDSHPKQRHLRLLGADLVFRLPFVGSLARKTGHTLACHPDAERLLRGGELVGVFPEGYKGIGKPFSARYKLQRFGRGGFISAALRAGVPIIPCAIIGAEEIYPKLGDIKPLARLLGLPYFPVTPFFPLLGPLGAIPLPTKWHIEFGEPVRTDLEDGDAWDDPMRVLSLTDRVRESMQQLLYERLAQRGGVFGD